MIKSLLILAFLTVVDPVTGPVGTGDLVPPTAAVYRNLAAFDLQEITVLDAPTVQLELQLGSFSNPYGLPLGFSHPVIDVYLGGGEYGLTELLPGHGMRLPEGELWSVAFRLTGDAARGYQVLADGTVQEFVPAVELVAGRLLVSTDLPAISSPRVAALVGLYDPFQETGWRPLAVQPNAWAFSSSEQIFPVLDVLAIDESAQQASLLSGILPVTEASSPGDPKTLWLMLMASGIAIAGAGLLLRTRTGRQLADASAGLYTYTEAVVVADSNRPEQTRGASQAEVAEARERLAAEAEVESVESAAELVTAASTTPTTDTAAAVEEAEPLEEAEPQLKVSSSLIDIFDFPDDRQSFEVDWEPATWLDMETVELEDHAEAASEDSPAVMSVVELDDAESAAEPDDIASAVKPDDAV